MSQNTQRRRRQNTLCCFWYECAYYLAHVSSHVQTLEPTQSNLFVENFISPKKNKTNRQQLTWEIATKSSVSIASTPNCLIARWSDPTEIQAMCFGRTFILVKKRSTWLMAVNRTSFDSSYQTFRHLKTCAAPSLVPIVISPSWD